MKRGFTLAEVLITLTVIGVVAAITMPTLNSNIQEQQVGPKLAKAINTLENGNKLLLQDNDARAITSIADCQTPEAYIFNPACISKYVKGTITDDGFLTNDGMLIAAPSGWNQAQLDSSDPRSNLFFTLVVDIDGLNKGLNLIGKDGFRLVVENKGSVMAVGSQASRDYIGGTWQGANGCQNKSSTVKTVDNPDFCGGSIVDNGYKVRYAYSSIH